MPFVVRTKTGMAAEQVGQGLTQGLLAYMQGAQLKGQIDRNKLLNEKTQKDIDHADAAALRAEETHGVGGGPEARFEAEEGRRLAEERRREETHGVGAELDPDTGEVITPGPQARYEKSLEVYDTEQGRLDDQYEQAEERLRLAVNADDRAEAQLVLDDLDEQRKNLQEGRAAALFATSTGALAASKAAFQADRSRMVDTVERQLGDIGVTITDEQKAAINAVGFSPTSPADLARVQADIYAQIGEEQRAKFLKDTEKWYDDPDKDHIMGAVETLANKGELWANPADIATVYRELGALERYGRQRAEIFNWTTADITNEHGFPFQNAAKIEEFESGIRSAVGAGGAWPTGGAQEANMNSVRNLYTTNIMKLQGALGIEPKWNNETNSFDTIDVSSIDSQLRTLMQIGVANGKQFVITVPRLGGGRPVHEPSAFERAPDMLGEYFDSLDDRFKAWWTERHGTAHPDIANLHVIKIDGAESVYPSPGYRWADDPDDDYAVEAIPAP